MESTWISKLMIQPTNQQLAKRGNSFNQLETSKNSSQENGNPRKVSGWSHNVSGDDESSDEKGLAKSRTSTSGGTRFDPKGFVLGTDVLTLKSHY